MSITIDNFPTYLALAGALVATAAYLLMQTAEGERRRLLQRIASTAYYVSLAAVGYLSVFLMQQLVAGRGYDIAYIMLNSSRHDELLYRISAFWAGQQGSLLLWALMTGLIGIAFVRKLGDRVPLAVAFWCSVQVFFLLVLVADDLMKPFADFAPGMAGGGLNPLLKNPWMAIHPPVVFLGYALLIVPALFAIAALVTGDAQRWSNSALPWTLAGWVSLSAGIALGMVWSYEVLGWGGYWGWDPVENASLVPWITATALVHGLLLQRVRGRFSRWNVILALATFLLVIYATYLTRSGVLSKVSVHSFADTPAFAFLQGFLVFYAAVCLIALAAGWKSIKGSDQPLPAASRDFGLALGVIVLVLFAVVVVAGTSYPLFAKGSIQAQFYNRMSAPLALVIAVLISLAPLMAWSRKDGPPRNGRALSAAGLGLVAVAVIALAAGLFTIVAPGVAERWFGWLISPDSSAGGIAVQGLLLVVGSAIVALIVNAAMVFRTRPIRAGASLAHAGVALLIVGVVISAAGKSETLELANDGSRGNALGWSFAYDGVRQSRPNSEQILLNAKRGGRTISTPLNIDYGERGAVRRPFIRSTFAGDLYVAPVQLEPTTVTATSTLSEEGWTSLPVALPGGSSKIALTGMQIESRTAILEYVPAEGAAKQLTVSADKPASIDGYTFGYQEFTSSGMGEDASHMTVGVVLRVAGRGLRDVAVIQVSQKPLIWLVWLGCGLILVGGTLATLRRRGENVRAKNGILPDNDRSDG